MALCLNCEQFFIEDEDRFCGNCGTQLPRLELENGGQIDVQPEDIEEEQIFTASVRNAGQCLLSFTLTQPENEKTVAVLDAGPHELRPFDDYHTVSFSLNPDSLDTDNLEGILASIPFVSSDPSQKSGHIRFVVPEPGAIEIQEEDLDIHLGLIESSTSDEERQTKTFTVELKNTGGSRVGVRILESYAEQTDSSIKVQLKGGVQESYVNGYSTEKIEFEAWTTAASFEELGDTFEIAFDGVSEEATSSRTIRLSAEVYAPPKPVFENIDLGGVIPNQVVPILSSVHNEGSSAFRIQNIESDNPFMKVLTKGATVAPGDLGASLEFIFSTRYAPEETVVNGQFITGQIIVTTDAPVSNTFIIHWQCEIEIPEASSGIFAIDFGTVNSCVAFYDREGEPEVVKREDTGSGHIPSMLIFRDEGVFVTGERALEDKSLVPAENVIHSVKRSLLEGSRTILGKEYEPIELASLVIEQLLLEVSHRHKTLPDKIAMSIPANFWGPLRDAMYTACRNSWNMSNGTSLKIDIIDEPTAVAMYYVYLNRERIRENSKERKILVYDFGGGTLDISIVKVKPSEDGSLKIGPIIARGDNQLGGIDIDVTVLRNLSSLAASEIEEFYQPPITLPKQQFEKKYKNQLGEFLKERYRWYDTSRQVKEKLSSENTVDFNIEPLLNKEAERLRDNNGALLSFDSELSRDDFESFIKDRISRSRDIVMHSLEQCDLKADDIDVALLTGLTCRIPYIRKAIGSMFPNAHIPEESEFPLKTSVVCGAALASYLRSVTGSKFKVSNLDRTSYRYGYLKLADYGASKKFVEVIPAKTLFVESEKSVRVPLNSDSEWCSIEIAQHGGKADVFDLKGTTEVSILGTIDIDTSTITPDKDGTVELTMLFSQEDGRLTVKINGEILPVVPLKSAESLENTYV